MRASVRVGVLPVNTISYKLLDRISSNFRLWCSQQMNWLGFEGQGAKVKVTARWNIWVSYCSRWRYPHWHFGVDVSSDLFYFLLVSVSVSFSCSLIVAVWFVVKFQECTKKKAVMSIMMVRNINEAKARSVVDRVFARCYADKEPFGRIPRGNSRDPERMLAEGAVYGYCNWCWHFASVIVCSLWLKINVIQTLFFSCCSGLCSQGHWLDYIWGTEHSLFKYWMYIYYCFCTN